MVNGLLRIKMGLPMTNKALTQHERIKASHRLVTTLDIQPAHEK